MSSVGQAVGMVVGGVIGFFAGGNVMLGASIGGAIGGALDPPKGPKVEGPRLSDTSQQTATYGASIPRIRASAAVSGNVFWIENNALKEVKKKESQGGKGGGGGAEVTSYTYYGTFAVGLCKCQPGEVKSLGRIWIGGQLYYNPTATTLEPILASTAAVNATLQSATKHYDSAEMFSSDGSFTFYNGSSTQLPDERMQAALGVDVVPGYRGLCYIVFKDLPLEKYANTIVGTRIKVELFDAIGSNHNEAAGAWPLTTNPHDGPLTVRIVDDKLMATVISYSDPNNDLIEITSYETLIGTGYVSMTGRSALPSVPDVYFGSHLFPSVIQSDAPVCLMLRYLNTDTQAIGFDSAGNKVIDTGRLVSTSLPYPLVFAVIDRGELFMCDDTASSRIYRVEGGLHDYSGPGLPANVVSSPVLSYPHQFGVSENYVFAVMEDNTSTSCTVVKLNRGDMTVAATYTQAVSSIDTKISVVDDRVFYTCGTVSSVSSPIVKWIDGVVVSMDAPVQYNDNWNGSGYERLISGGDLVHLVINGAGAGGKEMTAIFGSVSGQTTTLGEIVSAECAMSALLDPSDIDVTALTQEVRGYKVSNIVSIRSALEPLQACWPFDVIQHGYKIKFIPRGSSSVATIAEDELDARAGNDATGVRITQSREMSMQLPRRVEITYIDAAREYEIGPAGTAERLNTDSVNVTALEMPVVLTADEAAGKAEMLLYLYWLERIDLSITLPPTRVNLEPADVVTIVTAAATYTVRLTSINYLPDGRLEVTAKFASSAIYSPTQYGQAGATSSQVLTLKGATGLIPLDIPCITDAMNSSGFPMAVYGERAGWPGGAAVRSWDTGQTWESVADAVAPSPIVSRTVNTLASGRTDIIDCGNTIVLQPLTQALYSVSELELLAGANHFAVGADGRWEIVAAKTCTQQGDGTWVLSDLLRGRFGTEWATGLHQPLDTAVLLDANRIPFVGMAEDRLFVQGTYRGITRGATVDSGLDVPFTYNGNNFKCLAPVYINGGIDAATKDWTVTWLRRTRVGGEWRDYVDAPLSEASESYEAEIWNSTFTQLKRTFTGLTSATFTWTAAQQITDFLVEQQTIYVKIFQISDKVGRGYPAQISMQRALYVAPDPYWTNVGCLLHFDGVDGTNSFIEQKGKTVTIDAGTPTHKSASFKWGGTSIYFGGADQISVARHNDLGFPADGSIEFWINPDSNTAGSQYVYMSALNTSQKSIGLRLYRVTDTTWTPNLLLYPSTLAGTAGCILSNVWQFFQIIRSGNSVYFYRNGASVGTFTYNAGDTYDTYCKIGLSSFKGYIDDFRITKGVARAAATPTGPFPDA